jgi:hypothetical protein
LEKLNYFHAVMKIITFTEITEKAIQDGESVFA